MRLSYVARALVLCVLSAGFGKCAVSAEATVEFTDYGNSGLQLYDAKVLPSDVGYVLTGRLANAQAKYTLTNATLRIIAQDCSMVEGGAIVCGEIAHQDATIQMAIAPRTTSTIRLTLHFKEARGEVTGWLEWAVLVISAEHE